MKKTIKNNLPFIIFLIVLYFLLSFKLPYYIDTSGGLIDLKDRYKIDNEYKIKGSINMTYVSEYRATPITFIMSKFNNNFSTLFFLKLKLNILSIGLFYYKGF